MELNLKKVSEASFSYRWEEVLHKTDVCIQLPNLKVLESSVWGDWGLMYNFRLKPDQPILITYNEQSRALKQSSLQIESPMLADEREKFPYYILIEDKEYGFNHYLYLDRNFKLAKVTIKRIEDRIQIYEATPQGTHLPTAV